jgi:uncharacterized protein
VQGSGTHAFVPTDIIGTDATQGGIIYHPSVVQPVSAYKILHSAVNPSFIDTLNRPVLIQTFDQVATGSRLSVSVCHLKSKGSACAGDGDVVDGQGNCGPTLKNAAVAPMDYL